MNKNEAVTNTQYYILYNRRTVLCFALCFFFFIWNINDEHEWLSTFLQTNEMHLFTSRKYASAEKYSTSLRNTQHFCRPRWKWGPVKCRCGNHLAWVNNEPAPRSERTRSRPSVTSWSGLITWRLNCAWPPASFSRIRTWEFRDRRMDILDYSIRPSPSGIPKGRDLIYCTYGDIFH